MRISYQSIFLCTLFLFIQPVLANDELWHSLKKGGKVILMRHMPVEEGDSLARDTSCEKERNLSEEGKEKARLLANKFLSKEISIGDVYTSPYCRTKDTARIVFGKQKTLSILTLQVPLSDEEKEIQSEALNKLIVTYTGQSNLVLVTHRPNIESVSMDSIGQGDFIVIQPTSDGDFEELGVIHNK